MSAAIVALGAVSGLGEGDAAAFAGAVGEPARVVLRPDEELTLAGLARPFAARALPDVSFDDPTDRATAILLRAARGCADELTRVLPSWRSLRVGLSLGTSSGAMRTAQRLFGRHLDRHPLSREEAERSQYVAPMLEAVAALGIQANPATLVLGACAASTLAIGLGMRWLEQGSCDLVLAGGFDAVSVLVAAGFEVLRATTATLPPRPFRAVRDGMALGEGAAVVALIPASRAGALGVRARGYVAGFGASSDAVHLTAPDRTGSGLASAARRALSEAGVSTVDLISAHATATSFSDAAEARAIGSVLPGGRDIVVHPFKAQIGHTLGGSGVLEAMACIDAMQRGVLPAAAGDGAVDPDVDFRLLSVAEAGEPRVALKLSAAFGGANAALVVTRDPPRLGSPRPMRPVYLGRPVHLAEPPPSSTLCDQIGWPIERVARADPLARMALAAVLRLVSRDGPLTGAGVVVGAGFATLETDAAFFARIRERGVRMAEPRKFPYTSPNAAAGDCSAAFGLKGPSFAVGAGLHAALEALIIGATLVRCGDVDRLVVVGVDDVGPFVSRLAAALGVVATSGAVALSLSADPRGAIAELGATALGVGAARHAPVLSGHLALMPLLQASLPATLEASSYDSLPSSGGDPVGAWARAEILPQN